MSGGFFRGTSADQDTRFSNKQAKLLKSQKFAPELENLVDMTRVKMDVMRPWIAKRVTELIGFEDEVLINFIYTLLEGKEVNGKQIQISLTGFMERNTGKFMKELWTLLLSAQQNVSGVPQQFLDAKEEETKKKRAEKDHTINEIRKKEEKPEVEKTTMEGDGTFFRDRQAELELTINKDTDISRIQPEDDKDQNKRNDQRRISRGLQSPDSSNHFHSPRRKRSVSPSKSSNSRSYSDERRKSRSISRASLSRSRSISLERRQRSLPRRSATPHRKHSYRHSPSQWRRSTYSRRRSTSLSRKRSSPSPSRYRAHSRRRHISRSSRYISRSPVRHRLRTPVRASPMRYRSRTPLQHRPSSPIRRRSSPKERSPSFGRRKILSPVYCSSISPDHQHSASPVGQRSPSPHRPVRSPGRRRHQQSPPSQQEQSLSPVRHRSSVYNRKRSSPVRGKSPPPQELNSPLHIRHNSISPVKRGSPRSTRSPIKSLGRKARISEKYSPARCGPPDKRSELPAGNHKGVKSLESRPIVSLRSPQRDILEQDSEINKKELPPSVRKSPLLSGAREGRRSVGPHNSSYQKRDKMGHPQSPILPQRSSQKCHHDSPGATVDDDETNFLSRNIGKYKYRTSEKLSPSPVLRKVISDSVDIHVFTDETKSIKSQLPNSEMLLDKRDDKEYREYQVFSKTSEIVGFGAKGKESNNVDSSRATDKKKAPTDHSMGTHWVPELEIKQKLPENSEQNDQNGSIVFPSEEADGSRDRVNEKRKHKKLDKRELKFDDNDSYDSYEDRKEAKRRRKEEKKLKKGDRRRRREEKRRKRDERRAEKLKLKSGDVSSSSSDLGPGHSGDEGVRRQESRQTNVLKAESEQRKLEIELREKALESLRAKKGFGN